jgi:dimethylsulfone monooxygenase
MTTERIWNHVKFAYWVPNVSGGLVTSDIEQRTDWNYEYNARLAQTAENNGFEYGLSQVRYEASYGAEYQHESTSFSLALLLATPRLKVIAAVHPGLWQPVVLAKLAATADHVSGGRFAVNVVSGWFKDEFTHLGEPSLEHDERYRRKRIAAYRKRGVDLILGGFLHFQEEIGYFGSRVLPLVREIEAAEEDSAVRPVLAQA